MMTKYNTVEVYSDGRAYNEDFGFGRVEDYDSENGRVLVRFNSDPWYPKWYFVRV